MLIFNFSVTDGCTPNESCLIGDWGRICYNCAPSLYFINSNRVSVVGLSVMLYYTHAYTHAKHTHTHTHTCTPSMDREVCHGGNRTYESNRNAKNREVM